ncbi:DUF2480 family protein [Fulvivirgaceae bacterium BMA10]|uniref:DUF2480 family protein n=1 Tax=Splendidivirga corallicola TaxID=3051826 RepID=A0ABT8L0B2_9BACT|nr:DUF2480 family protein [Fulvivirgaceae bacterium BMA10]
MNKEDTIINRVSQSSLISFDLEEYYDKHERIVYDIKDNLFQGLILKEKEFRTFIKENDWSRYQDKNVAITCTADAIVPTWAYMLLATKLEPYTNMVVFGDIDALNEALFRDALSKINFESFQDAKVVIKGCSNLPVPESAYVEIARLMRPYVTSMMYGEPCSTVPIYKKPKAKS